MAVDGVGQTDNHLDKLLTLGHLQASLHGSRLIAIFKVIHVDVPVGVIGEQAE